jgi:hypothetical protein
MFMKIGLIYVGRFAEILVDIQVDGTDLTGQAYKFILFFGFILSISYHDPARANILIDKILVIFLNLNQFYFICIATSS